MLTIAIRTIIIYLFLIFAMRLMGKRQIGQLEVSDLVSTLLLSEIAALPIENRDIPISFALVPTVVLMTIEIVSAAAQGRFPKLKNLFSPRPSVLVRMGTPDFRELERSRISMDELMVSLRKSGVTDLSEIAYAILEQDGNISVIPKAFAKNLTPKDMGISTTESGMFRIVIERGIVNHNSLSELGKDETWLARLLQNDGVLAENVILLLVDEGGNKRIFTTVEEKQ